MADGWFESSAFGDNFPSDAKVYFRDDETIMYVLHHKGEFTLRYDEGVRAGEATSVLKDPVISTCQTLEAAKVLYALNANNPKYAEDN